MSFDTLGIIGSLTWTIATILIMLLGTFELISRRFYPNIYYRSGLTIFKRLTNFDTHTEPKFVAMMNSSPNEVTNLLAVHPLTQHLLGLMPTRQNQGKRLPGGGANLTHGQLKRSEDGSQLILDIRINLFAIVFCPYWMLFAIRFPLPIFNILFALFGAVAMAMMFRKERMQYFEFWENLIHT